MKTRPALMVLLISIVMLAFIAISCGGGDVSQAVNATLTAIALQTPSPTLTPADSPEKAATIWLDALLNLDGNVLAQRTCRAQREAVQAQGMWDSALTALGQLLVGQKTKGDISGLQFLLEVESGDKARVRVMGELSTAVLGAFETREVDETWLMVREDGIWRWCGAFGVELSANPTKTSQPTLAPKAVNQPFRLIPYRVDTVDRITVFQRMPPTRLIGPRDEEAGPGWKYVVVRFAIENTTGKPARFPISTLGIENAQLLTEQGYTYPTIGAQIPSDWFPQDITIPANFRVRALHNPRDGENARPWILDMPEILEFVLIFKVADGTHPGRINIPSWGDISLSGTLQHPTYPTERPRSDFESINTPWAIPNKGEIEILSARSEVDLVRKQTYLKVTIKYRNASAGYGESFNIGLTYIGDDGMLVEEEQRQSEPPGATTSDGKIVVGPGQQVEVVHTFLYPKSSQNGKLIVEGDTSGVVHLDVKPSPPLRASPLPGLHSGWSGAILDGLGNLNDIWGSSGSNIFVVGDNGLIIHYDGAAWSAMGSNTIADLSSVWGTSGDNVFAAGVYGFGGVVLHYDGRGWSSVGEGPVKAIWGSSANDVWAVGPEHGVVGGTILHFDGVMWSEVESDIEIDSEEIWGSSASNLWIIDGGQRSSAL